MAAQVRSGHVKSGQEVLGESFRFLSIRDKDERQMQVVLSLSGYRTQKNKTNKLDKKRKLTQCSVKDKSEVKLGAKGSYVIYLLMNTEPKTKSKQTRDQKKKTNLDGSIKGKSKVKLGCQRRLFFVWGGQKELTQFVF